jgi:hypothetical protein
MIHDPLARDSELPGDIPLIAKNCRLDDPL